MVIELITGHVFANGSVKAVTPLQEDPVGGASRFKVIGVGFTVEVAPMALLRHGQASMTLLMALQMIEPNDHAEVEWMLSSNLDSDPIDETSKERTRRLLNKYVFSHQARRKFAERVHADSVSKLLGGRSTRPSDTEILDFLDRRVERVIEGQTETDPYGEHVANRWVIEQHSSNVRDAILQLMKGHEFSQDPK